jgi:hypothetical protein
VLWRYIVKMEKTKILKITQERKVKWGENLMYMYIDFNYNLMCMMKKIFKIINLVYPQTFQPQPPTHAPQQGFL